MKRRTIVCLFALLLSLIFVGALFAYHNSYSIALNKAGLSAKSINYVDIGIDDNGNEYRVVFEYMPENTLKIVFLSKDDFGIWRVIEEASGSDSEAEYITMGWMRFSSIGRFDVNDQVGFDFEVHKVYGGNNATKQIEIPMELLPTNVSVNVFQSGTRYVIHFIGYGDGEILDQFYFDDLLEQSNCIQP